MIADKLALGGQRRSAASATFRAGRSLQIASAMDGSRDRRVRSQSTHPRAQHPGPRVEDHIDSLLPADTGMDDASHVLELV
jgi:hypothetical protein